MVPSASVTLGAACTCKTCSGKSSDASQGVNALATGKTSDVIGHAGRICNSCLAGGEADSGAAFGSDSPAIKSAVGARTSISRLLALIFGAKEYVSAVKCEASLRLSSAFSRRNTSSLNSRLLAPIPRLVEGCRLPLLRVVGEKLKVGGCAGNFMLVSCKRTCAGTDEPSEDRRMRLLPFDSSGDAWRVDDARLSGEAVDRRSENGIHSSRDCWVTKAASVLDSVGANV